MHVVTLMQCVTVHTDHLVRAAVQVDHPLLTGQLMQPVDILSDQLAAIALLL